MAAKFEIIFSSIEFNQWMRTHFYFIYQTLSPFIIGVILIISWANHEPFKKGDYEYPGWANGMYSINTAW